MPFFPEYNALFIHIPKNAGRSIESLFLPEGLTPDAGRRSFINRAMHFLQQRTVSPVPQQRLLGSLDVVVAAQHLTYQEIHLLGLLPARTLATAFSFCVVRNPYDRVLSTLRHFAARFATDYSLQSPAEIEQALAFWLDLEPDDHNLRAHRRPQAEYVLSAFGDMAITDVLRFETLAQDMGRVFGRLSLPPAPLPWVGKMRPEADRQQYRAFFTPGAQRRVAQAYERDLELFGYDF